MITPTPKFIIFNGPPKSGKSSAAIILANRLQAFGKNVVTDSFVAPMKRFVSTLLADKYTNLDKERPIAEFRGDSARRFLIDLSETYIKPKYGDDFFGRMLAYRILREPLRKPDYVVVDDSGFQAEADALPNKRVIKVMRAGTDYTNDSRSYLEDYWWLLDNNKTIEDLSMYVFRLADDILKADEA